MSCAEDIEDVDKPKALGCGESYSLTSTENTCCEGHESVALCFEATACETDGECCELRE